MIAAPDLPQAWADADQARFGEWWAATLAAKAPLAELLGMGSDRRLCLGAAIVSCQEWRDLAYGLLARAWPMPRPISDCDIDSAAALLPSGYMPLADGRKIRIGRWLSRPEFGLDVDAQTMLLARYEALAARSQSVVWLSAHPADILLSGEGPYTSCHSLIGEYAAGVLAYGLDTQTLVAYTAAPGAPVGEKLGRALVWMDQANLTVLVGRGYGWISADHAAVVTAAITRAMSRALGVSHTWVGDALPAYGDLPLTMERDNFPGYWDTRDILRYTWHRSHGAHKADSRMTITLAPGMCLLCGHGVEGVTSSGVPSYACPECAHERVMCYGCSEYIHPDRGDLFEANNELYCHACYSDRFTVCDCCDEAVDRDRVADVLTIRYCRPSYRTVQSWCDCCADDRARTCACCDTLIACLDAHETPADTYLCGICGAVCPECDLAYPKADLNAVGACPDCALSEVEEVQITS